MKASLPRKLTVALAVLAVLVFIAEAALGEVGTGSANASGEAPNGTCGFCVLATSGESLQLTSSANLSLSKGHVIVNSSGKPAVAVTGSGSLQAPSVGVSGTVSITGTGTVQNLTTGIAPIGDPLAGLPVPSLTVPSPVPSVSVTGSTGKTITPGVYKEITDTGSGGLTLSSGTYVVLSKFADTGSGALTAPGVTLYLACSSYPMPCKSGEKGALLTLTGSGPVNFTGPEEGCSPVSIFADRNSTASLSITGSSNQALDGVIYAKSGSLNLTGSGSTFVIGGPIDVGGAILSGSGNISVAGTLPLTEGLSLALSGAPTSARVGETETLTATLSCHGKLMANQSVAFSVTGANPHNGSVMTNASGVASFSYKGAATGTDTAQASYTGGGASVTSTPTTIKWAKAQPAITTAVKAASVTLGEPIADTATVTGGASPTGTVTFNVYAASDTSCKTPLSTPLTASLAGGQANSPSFTPTGAGTYQFLATYGGDATNESIAEKCGESSEKVTVSPTIGPVTGQPSGVTVDEGQSASFTAVVAANPAASAQWQVSSNEGKSWSNDTTDTASTSSEAGKTTSTLTVKAALHSQNGYEYRAVFTNTAGSVTSNGATLTVDWIGPITTQPESQTISEGHPATFMASADSNPASTVRWEVSSSGGLTWEPDTSDKGSTVGEPGRTTSTLTVANAVRADSGYEYRAVFTNAAGTVTSTVATITIDWIGPIQSQPQSATANEGTPVSFTAASSAYPAASVQWQFSANAGSSWSNDSTDSASTSSEPGKTTSTLTLASASRAQNGYEYRAVFSNAGGSTTSNAAMLTVHWIGLVATQPESRTVNEGQSTSVVAAVAANPAASVQWQLSSNGGSSWSNDTSDTASNSSEAGKTTSTLTISSASRAQNGYEYRAIFTNTAGSATSNAASLTVEWIGPVSTQPESQATAEGKTVSLTAAASSNPSASVQWQYSIDSGAEWANDTTDSATTTSSDGTTTSTLSIASAKHSQSGYEYRAIFTNPAGTSTSSAASVIVEPASRCTDTYDGPSGGLWQTASNWSTGSTPTSSDVACVGPGTTVDVTEGTNVAGVLLDQGGLAMLGGSLELSSPAALIVIPGLEVSTTSTLNLSGGTLSLGGTLDVSSALSGGGAPVISGSGRLVLEPGASGTLDSGNCSTFPELNGATFVNDGTFTFGHAGGSTDGAFLMANGAQVQNAGTFNDDSYDPGCGRGYGGSSIANLGGTQPSVSNTGSFNVNLGSPSASTQLAAAFNNSGTLEDEQGTINLSAGGSGTHATWSAASEATLAFAGGSFALDEDTWSGEGTVAVNGAAVSATALKGTHASASVSGGTLTIDEGPTATSSKLTLVGGTLSLDGELDVSSALSGGGAPVISGSGRLVLEPGASGTLDSGNCSTFPELNGATFVNDGTFTFGHAGGSTDGAFLMANGAQVQNAGTFNDDSYDPGCGRGYGGSSIANLGGTQPSVSNTGSFNVNLGSPSASTQLAAAFNNSGTLEDEQGTINLSAGGSGTHATWSAASEATLVFAGGTYALSGDSFTGEGTVGVGGATVTAKALRASAASTLISGGTLAINEGPVVPVSHLTLAGGTLSLGHELDVSSTLSASGAPVVAGTGKLVLEPGATGTLDGGNCNTFLELNGATFVNDGTATFGHTGGSTDGAFLMANGAQIENAGTFNDDSYDPGCGRGYGGSSIENLGGTQSSITNTGSFNVNLGGSSQIGVGFLNDGSVRALGGTVNLTDGGIEEQVATGCWYAESGALNLSAGTFVIEEGGTFQATVSGAKVTFTATGLSGSLEAPPHAAGTITLKGHGEESNTRFVFAHATVEATPKGSSDWKAIGAPLTPDSHGNFSTQWNTASGAYPDGPYELRAKISNNCACERSIYTTPSAVRVANSPLTLSPSKGGPDAIGASQAFTATLSGASGEPLAGKTVELHVAGANPKTLTALTNSEGEASFSYKGATQGTDKVQASYAPSGEAPITSNTASVSWFLALREVSSTPIQGNFYPANDSASGFSAKPGDTPVFSQTFPTIDFNPQAVNPTVVGSVENGEGGPFSGAGSVAFSGQGALLSPQTPIKARANWTLEAWIDPAKLSQEGMVIYNGDHGGGNGFGFGVFGQNGSAGGCLTGLYELVTWINTPYCFSAANQWYYVAEVNVEGTVTFYVNGTQVYRASEPTPYTPSGQMIGGYGASSERDFYGQISNAAYYTRPLSAAEIRSHYGASQASNVSQFSYGGTIETGAPAAFYALSKVPHNTDPWFVTPETRPFTDLTTDETGAVNGTIPAQGNELKAGVGSLETFEASFTAKFEVAQAGDVTFKITSEDGFLLGVGGGASRVSGEYEGAPESNTSVFQGLPLAGAYDKTYGSEPQAHLVTVHFPGPGSYPYELDYFLHGGKQLSLQMEVQSVIPDASPLSVFVGYADGLRPSGNIFPFPWEGSPGVNFIGQLGPGYDSGALRLDNSGETPISLEDVSVDIGSAHTELWGNHIEVAPHGITILAQTEGNNFDTSDEPTILPCSETPASFLPQIHVTSAGSTTTYQDTGQVLNTGGIDPGDCNQNESHAWTRIGGEGVPINVPMPPAVSLELSPSRISGDQVGQTQSISIHARNAGGADIAGLPITVNIYGPNARNISLTTNAAGVAEGSYVGHIAGKDNISATASVEGLQAASNQLIVPWAVPLQPPPPPPPTEVSEGEAGGGEPPSVEIITPFGGSIVTGNQPVIGYVSGEASTHWSLTLSPAGGDATPVQLASGTGSVELSTLGTIEASKLGPGSYTLALTAKTGGGSATETVPLTIGSKPGVPPPPPTETSSGAPTLSEESPASGSVIGVTTAVSAHATAPEGQTISGWTVTLTPLAEGTPTVVGETTAEHPSTLAVIEPERFKSGTYTLTIEVKASGGGYATSSATVTLGVGVPITGKETKEEKEHKEEKETKEEKEHREEKETKEEKETTQVASPPEIGEVTPVSGTVITAPTPIRAHISAPSGESIASWTVAYQGSEQHATTFASGKGAPPETLATFDPTRLANGDYKITVTATTTGGGVQSESTSLTVSGNLKLGRYLKTYKDLEIPVAGFNMDVKRVYDSTNKSVGDFGVGWNLMLSNFKVQTNGLLGEGGWVQRESECLFSEPTESEPGEESAGLCAYAYESRPQHTVTVTLPDGQTEVFVFEPHGEYFNNLEVLPRFSAKPGTDTTSTLEVDEPTEILNGFNGTLYDGGFENPWTAQTFLLTTRTGVRYVLNTERGLISEEALDHDKLTFTASGIESSAGSKLTFTRGSQGRITEITGPSGQHLHYHYDAAGNLELLHGRRREHHHLHLQSRTRPPEDCRRRRRQAAAGTRLQPRRAPQRSDRRRRLGRAHLH